MEHDVSKIQTVMRRVDDVLATAHQGLADVLSEDPIRRMTGLHNVIVFGRTVTFVLQNLSSATKEFGAWYAPEQDLLKADPMMRFMVDARNEILKQGKLNVAIAIDGELRGQDIPPRGSAPVGATSFFIGDQLGGSGWLVTLPDGTTEKYYVALRGNLSVTRVFADLPVAKFPELAGLTVDQIVTQYIEKLDALVDRARRKFLPDGSHKPTTGSDKRGGHLKLVKG